MRILVTGGAGFIGSTVADAYIEKGHQVWIVDDGSTGNRRNVNKRARVAWMDICNKKRMTRFFQQGRFDVVNHHAAQIDVRKSVADPELDARINILGILNVLTLSQCYKVKKFLFSSSGGTVYGECSKPASENSPEVPLSPYGVAKLASEKYIKAFASLHRLKYTIFRYSNVYGPRQDPRGEAGVVSIFSQHFLKGEVVTIYGSGSQTRDFVYVKDVARANVLGLSKAVNETINIGIGREISVNDLYREMAKIVGCRTTAQHKAARAGELQRSVLNIAKAKKILGWEPAYTLAQGLRETIRYFSS